MIMCLELMKEMMRGVRICYFIEGCHEFCLHWKRDLCNRFFFFFLHTGK